MKNFNPFHSPSRDWRKTLFHMKLTAVVLLCSVGALTASPTFSQTTRLDVSYRGTSLVSVLEDLQTRTGYYFVYFDGVVPGDVTVTASLSDASLEEVLAEVLTRNGLTYRINNSVIGIGKADEHARQQPAATRVTGTVVDERGRPVSGASVMVAGFATGTTSDPRGRFEITLPAGHNTLEVSYIGMATQRVEFSGQTHLTVTMTEASVEISDIVVTGMFERRKEGFAGSATIVGGDRIRQLGAGNPLRALGMIDPSFTIGTSNLSGSNPNAVSDYQMRGSASIGNYESYDASVLRGDLNSRPNQPLFVLDGIIGVDVTAIMDIDPEQIASITMLKDAAATVIYGSDAANGVVVVETLKPEAGRLKVTYNGKYGITWPDLNGYDLANAAEKLEIEKRAGYPETASTDPTAVWNYYNEIEKEVLRGVNTDWLAIPVRTVGTHRHAINFEGGDETLRYKIHLGANFSPGVMKQTGLDGQSGRVDLHYRTGKFQIINQTLLDYSKGRRESNYGSFSQYALMNPYYTPYDENGNLKRILDPQSLYIGEYNKRTFNPVYNTLYNMRNEFREFRVQEQLKLQWRPVEALRFDMDFMIAKTKGNTDVFKPSHHTDFALTTRPEEKGSYVQGRNDRDEWRLSLTASWNKLLGERHMLSAFGRWEINQRDAFRSSIEMTGFPNDKLSEIFTGTTYKSISGEQSMTRSVGAVFTGNYSYDRRYAADVSVRADAASQFGRDNRMAPFWSVGAKWSAHNEKFMSGAGFIDELILRASIGTTGSQDFNPWQSLQTYTFGNTMSSYTGSDVVGATLLALGNPDLKWQQTITRNLALDFTLWDGLFGARLEVYDRLTKNALLDFSLPPSVGFSTVKENLGEISNKGCEATVRFMPWRNTAQRAYWTLTLNGAYNRSTIEKISDAMKNMNDNIYSNADSDLTRPLPQYVDGMSSTAIWGVRSLGIDPQTGDEIYITRGGGYTTAWSAADRVIIGERRPDLSGNIISTLSWRDLTLTISAGYTFGGQIYNQTLADKVENANLRLNVDRRVLTGRWSQPGDVSPFKGLNGSDTRARTNATSRFVMDNNELRLSSVNLAYRLSSENYKFLRGIGMGSATVALYCEDVARLSTVRMERGINYPFARTVSMSLNLAF